MLAPCRALRFRMIDYGLCSAARSVTVDIVSIYAGRRTSREASVSVHLDGVINHISATP